MNSFERLIRRILSGLTIPQQYVCLGLDGFTHPLKVILECGDETTDVTDSHLFLGYKPLLFAFPLHVSSSFRPDRIVDLRFVTGQSDAVPIASLQMKALPVITRPEAEIVVCRGMQGSHRFISGFHQVVQRLKEKLKRSAPGNVSLEGNLHDQVRIAYAIPRIISLISVMHGSKANLFPTDLHGPVGDDFYLGSLRINGKATEQVERYNDIVISEIPSDQFRIAYHLGRNHMKDLQPLEDLNFSGDRSHVLGHPLPVGCLGYRELRRLDSFDIGIHRIHLYKVLYHARTKAQNPDTLAHINQYYAQWRLNNGYHTRMLFR